MPSRAALPALRAVRAPDDEDLFRRLKAGERNAQDVFFRLHVQFVGHVVRAAGARNDLEDAVQETFVEAFKSMHTLQDVGALRSWLARLAVRQVARKRRFRAWLTLFSREADEHAAWEDLLDPSASADVVLEVRNVGRALDALPTDERLCWILRYWHGLTLEATARACDTSLATAKRRLARADAVVMRWREERQP